MQLTIKKTYAGTTHLEVKRDSPSGLTKAETPSEKIDYFNKEGKRERKNEK